MLRPGCTRVQAPFTIPANEVVGSTRRGSAAISLGRSLRQRVVAEGVETREQLAFLKTRFCDDGQGYYFGRPVVAEKFAQLLGAPLRPPLASRPVSALAPDKGAARKRQARYLSC